MEPEVVDASVTCYWGARCTGANRLEHLEQGRVGVSVGSPLPGDHEVGEFVFVGLRRLLIAGDSGPRACGGLRGTGRYGGMWGCGALEFDVLSVDAGFRSGADSGGRAALELPCKVSASR